MANKKVKKEKTEKAFEVKGKFKEKGEMKAFSKSVSAFNEGHAKDKVYGLMGSKHRVLRRMIEIDEVNEAKKE
ncbi:MAG: 50S ribosomal protein L18Ae [Candidatus Diapherotrites archaeon]